jgi:hypothetical protein
MAYWVTWLAPKRVVYFEIDGVLTIPILDEIGKEIVALLDAGDPPCYVIANVPRLTEVPKNIPQIHGVTKPYLDHPNMKWIFVCSSNALVNFIATVIGQVIGTSLFAGRTMDDALEVITKHEPNLAGNFDQNVMSKIVQ